MVELDMSPKKRHELSYKVAKFFDPKHQRFMKIGSIDVFCPNMDLHTLNVSPLAAKYIFGTFLHNISLKALHHFSKLWGHLNEKPNFRCASGVSTGKHLE